MATTVTYWCPECKRVRKGSAGRRWCDLCGAEVRAFTYGKRKRVRRGR